MRVGGSPVSGVFRRRWVLLVASGGVLAVARAGRSGTPPPAPPSSPVGDALPIRPGRPLAALAGPTPDRGATASAPVINQPTPTSAPQTIAAQPTRESGETSIRAALSAAANPVAAGPSAATSGTAPPVSVPPAIRATPSISARVNGPPSFSDVSQETPAEIIAFLRGQHPRYPRADTSAARNFSPSDILETMDTIVLDRVAEVHGPGALLRVYDVIASDILASLRATYPNGWILVALDAGHGGKKGFFWDAGSEGTEAEHTRAVVDRLRRLAGRPENERILLRSIYNDAIADDLGFGPRSIRTTLSSILVRQTRAAMLAQEVQAWNAGNASPADRVALHEISVHFNSGAGGALVLHQGETVRSSFRARSITWARDYLDRVRGDLNRTGLLPTPLTLWAGTGLHDDVMMYRPEYLGSGTVPKGVTLRYGALQGRGYMPIFIQLVLQKNATRR